MLDLRHRAKTSKSFPKSSHYYSNSTPFCKCQSPGTNGIVGILRLFLSDSLCILYYSPDSLRNGHRQWGREYTVATAINYVSAICDNAFIWLGDEPF